MSVFFSLITKRTTVPSLCRFNICASGGSRPEGKVGARSQTICFCSFTVLVFYGVSVASVQKQTKGGGGGGGEGKAQSP